jgi:hypothetical protein
VAQAVECLPGPIPSKKKKKKEKKTQDYLSIWMNVHTQFNFSAINKMFL